MDLDCLKDAGLTDGEIKVYFALLELGSSTIGPILERSDVTKSIIYRILKRLIDKGLVSHIIRDKTKHFQAAPPQKLLEYIDKKQSQIKKNREKVEKLIPELVLKQNFTKLSEATIYEGFKGIMTVHSKRYDRLKKGDECVYLGLPQQQPEYYHSYWIRDSKKRAQLGIKQRLLYNKKIDDNVLKNRNSMKLTDARRMTIAIDTPSWVMIYNDITVIVIPLSKKPIAFEIMNEEVAKSFKNYFEWFWKRSKPFLG